MTAEQLKLVNEYDLDNTFLLQYDAVCDADFVSLFKENATDKTELGLWYEIVEPLTSACGIECRSEHGWKWDWHIIPGFSMAYTPRQRELLIIVDTMTCPEADKKQCGLMIAGAEGSFAVNAISEGVLEVCFGAGKVTFREDRIEIQANKLVFYGNSIKAEAAPAEEGLRFTYNGVTYLLRVEGAEVIPGGENFEIISAEGNMTLMPQKG